MGYYRLKCDFIIKGMEGLNIKELTKIKKTGLRGMEYATRIK